MLIPSRFLVQIQAWLLNKTHMLLLIFAILSLIETTRHWYVIEKLKRSPNKLISFVARFCAGVCFFISDTGSDIPIEVLALAYLITDWWIHDYVLNLLRGVKPIWYLNSTGLIDILQNNYPSAFGWFIWKTIMFVGALGMYYLNDYSYYY